MKCTQRLRKLLLVFHILNYCSSICGNNQMEGHIVGGDYVDIEEYPHAACLAITCHKGYQSNSYKCGSSIINQHFTLTAAHCLHECDIRRSYIMISVGHHYLKKALKSSANSFMIHEKYEDQIIFPDIALVQLKTPLTLGSKVQRVALLKPNEVPNVSEGFVAGWGETEDKKGNNYLKHVRQPLWSRKNCTKFLGAELSLGQICAGFVKRKDYADQGDSGSALVINRYIQIGIVSYKFVRRSPSILVYTDVSHFYNWITGHTRRMHCKHRQHANENGIVDFEDDDYPTVNQEDNLLFVAPKPTRVVSYG
ncbi:chymotrypsin-1-like [Ostrinia nubilalis]|uniref:chymotrypsin-1-like n=1 Tax=Ostrinia nubilalis TaxID=29057 RepID=UPI00308260E9